MNISTTKHWAAGTLGAILALLVTFGFVQFSFALTEISSDPVYGEDFFFYCTPYEESFEEGGSYSPNINGHCFFSLPDTITSVGTPIFGLYRGTPGNSNFVMGGVGQVTAGTTLVQEAIFFDHPQPEEDFFATVYDSAISPGNAFHNYLLNSANNPLPDGAIEGESYYILRWKFPPDTAPPVIVIDTPVNGATYAAVDTVFINVTITDSSEIVEERYFFNGAEVDGGSPLPLGSAPLGSAQVVVSATDAKGNIGYATSTFTIADGTPPPPQCADGEDNDNDSVVDLNDPGCESAEDNDESNDPPSEEEYAVMFLEPITSEGHTVNESTSVFKRRSTIPVKFKITNNNGEVAVLSSSPAWIEPVKLGPMSSPVTEPVYTEQPSSGSTYEWKDDKYQYNWSTKKVEGGHWYQLYVILENGQMFSTIIGLR